MTLFKKLIVSSLSAYAVLMTAAHASSVTTAQLADNYIGSNGGVISTTDSMDGNNSASVDNNYNTHWMQVGRVIENGTATLTVTINSNFVSHNNSTNLSFGDLFLMDADKYNNPNECADLAGSYGCDQYSIKSSGEKYGVTAASKWDYAFDLGDAAGNSYDNDVTQTGTLQDITNTDGYQAYKADVDTTKNNENYRKWQAVEVDTDNTQSVGSGGTWKTLIDDNELVMSFDITGTSLETADQIALRWAMTCANDIIEVVADLKSTVVTHVSEPTTVMLMMSAFAGLFIQRRRSRA